MTSSAPYTIGEIKEGSLISDLLQRVTIIPRHMAIIMDGNGRWAKERNLSIREGHEAGYRRIRHVVKLVDKAKVKYLTLFGFSTENWGRPRDEVDSIMSLVEKAEEEIYELYRNNTKISHIGRKDRLPSEVLKWVEYATCLTENCTGLNLAIAFDYGGRDEIVQAARQLVEEQVPSHMISEEVFSKRLFTAAAPDPDIIIRTGGEFRISNFLLWQAAYAEFYSSDLPWPEFGEKELANALETYSERRRRFGRVH